MAAPTATQIRDLLEGYGITSSVLSDGWVERCRDEEVIPHVEEITGLTFSEVSTVTEYYNGNGKSVLILNRRPVISVTKIQYTNQISEGNLEDAIELIPEEGIIKGVSDYNEGIYSPLFRKGDKNVKVTYTYGFTDYPTKIFRAIKNLVAAKMLDNVGNRTGGGDLSVQAFSRSYGPNGKYTHKMKNLIKSGYALLKGYSTGVVGG
jgi:hypothetical protein